MGELVDRVNRLPQMPRSHRYATREVAELMGRSISRVSQIASGTCIAMPIGRIDKIHGVTVATFSRLDLILLARHFERRKQIQRQAD